MRAIHTIFASGLGIILLGAQEEEQLVLDDRATDVCVVDRLRTVVALVVRVQIPYLVAGSYFRRDEGIGVVGVLLRSLPARRIPFSAETEVPFIGAGPADLVDHAADGAAVLGTVARD